MNDVSQLMFAFGYDKFTDRCLTYTNSAWVAEWSMCYCCVREEHDEVNRSHEFLYITHVYFSLLNFLPVAGYINSQWSWLHSHCSVCACCWGWRRQCRKMTRLQHYLVWRSSPTSSSTLATWRPRAPKSFTTGWFPCKRWDCHFLWKICCCWCYCLLLLLRLLLMLLFVRPCCAVTRV